MKHNKYVIQNLTFKFLLLFLFTIPSVLQALTANSGITSPRNGSQLTSTSVTFRWKDTGASQYYLRIGTSRGAYNLYNRSQGKNTSKTVTNLPSNGSKIYVRLYTYINGYGWKYNDYVYTSKKIINTKASIITSPRNGSQLTSTSVTFRWKDTGASQYYLRIGTSRGAYNLYNRSQGKNTSKTVTNLPSNGSKIYVRLYTYINGYGWRYNDYVYTSYKEIVTTEKSVITSPRNGSKLTSTSVTFRWKNTGASQYHLLIKNGNKTLYNRSQGRNTYKTVTNLPSNGDKIQVTLYSLINNKWFSNQYTYESYKKIIKEELPLVIIRIEFKDYKFKSSASVWSKKIFGMKEGELNHYFNEISYAKFKLKKAEEIEGTKNDGVITVKLNENHPGNSDEAFLTQIKRATALADDYINFKNYDKDNNKAISKDELQIMFLVAGGESAMGIKPGIWAHAWSMSSTQAPTHDGVRLMSFSDNGKYSRFGERQGESYAKSYDATIGVIAHELGHAIFGLSDLYDTSNNSSGIGRFGLMAGGSWGKKSTDKYSGQTPVHMTGWSKIKANFITPTTIQKNINDLKLKGVSFKDAKLYKIPTGISTEYFLIENRSANGYDKGLDSLNGTDNHYSGGLLILHIDDNKKTNSDKRHKLVDVEEANNAGLDSKKDRGHQNNLFFNGNATEFTSKTTPNSNRYDGKSSGISITNISNEGSTMSVDIKVK